MPNTQRIVKRVAQVFLANDKVTTTRLHGHIFSCLLEIPNRVCDNSYGKNNVAMPNYGPKS